MKKRRYFALLLAAVCSVSALGGCGRKDVLEFSRYYGKDLEVFLEDHELSLEEFEKEEDIYRSKELLPFMGYEAAYEIGCDEENQLLWTEVSMEEAIDNAEELYEKATDISSYYEDRKDTECLLDGTSTEYPSEFYLGDIRGTSYENYMSFKEGCPVYRGLWALEDGMQVYLTYEETAEEAVVQVQFFDSESEMASSLKEE